MTERLVSNVFENIYIPLLIPAVLTILALLSFILLFSYDKIFELIQRKRRKAKIDAITKKVLLSNVNTTKNIEFKLHRLKWPVSITQFKLINVLISILLVAVSILLLNNYMLAILVVIIWHAFAYSIVNLQYEKYCRKLEIQAETMLQLLAEAFKITEDIVDAIVMIIPSTHSPLKEELELLVKEYCMGKDLDLCLKNFAIRCDNRDIEMFVQGVILAKKYSTDLSMVIEETSKMIRERILLRDELESEVKGRGVVLYLFLIAVPAIFTFLLINSPEARNVFLNTEKGQILVCIAVLLQFGTWYLYQRKSSGEML